MQKMDRKQELQIGSNLDQLQSELEQLKEETPELVQMREVILVYKSCCGCGCKDLKLRRIVPADSDLVNGDRAYDLEDADEFI